LATQKAKSEYTKKESDGKRFAGSRPVAKEIDRSHGQGGRKELPEP
jgi:hypothetical protein